MRATPCRIHWMSRHAALRARLRFAAVSSADVSVADLDQRRTRLGEEELRTDIAALCG